MNFAQYKNAALEVKNKTVVDAEISSLIETINTSNLFMTKWSCCGHTAFATASILIVLRRKKHWALLGQHIAKILSAKGMRGIEFSKEFDAGQIRYAIRLTTQRGINKHEGVQVLTKAFSIISGLVIT